MAAPHLLLTAPLPSARMRVRRLPNGRIRRGPRRSRRLLASREYRPLLLLALLVLLAPLVLGLAEEPPEPSLDDATVDALMALPPAPAPAGLMTVWKSTSTPSSRGRNGGNIASMAWGV